MRSKNKGFISQIEDLLLQIEKLEHLISMHRKASHSIEVKQFESLKLGFVKDLLTLLINSNLNLAEPQTFPLVYRLLENLYPESIQSERHSPEYMDIESVLSPVLFKRKQTRNYLACQSLMSNMATNASKSSNHLATSLQTVLSPFLPPIVKPRSTIQI